MNPEIEDLTGHILASKYRLERLLGVGGFGAVYEATHLLGRAKRAIKVLHRHRLEDPVACHLFVKEAQAVMRLDTPRAVLVHDVDHDDTGRLFIVMELLHGETLSDYLRRKRKEGQGLPVEEAVRIGCGVLEALCVAHAKGVIHRDLKPGNVMLIPREDGPPEVKVVDFGIARLLSFSQTGETSTELMLGPIGTPQYMSPEQCLGKEVDARSDLYSFGVMLYEMLAGRLPFESTTPQGFAIAHVTQSPRPITTLSPKATVPEELERLVLRLLAKDPAERPQSAAEVLNALRTFTSQRAKVRTGLAGETKGKRRPVLVGAVGVVVATALGFLLWLWRFSPGTNTPAHVPPLGVQDAIEGSIMPPVGSPAATAHKDIVTGTDSGLATSQSAPKLPSSGKVAPPKASQVTKRPSEPLSSQVEGSRLKTPARDLQNESTQGPGQTPKEPARQGRPSEPLPPKEPPTFLPHKRPTSEPRNRWDAAFDELEEEIRRHGPR